MVARLDLMAALAGGYNIIIGLYIVQQITSALAGTALS
jgi:hypothetical protein